MVTVPEFVIDTLNGLLEAEANNVFRVVAKISPHVNTAEASIRDPIAELRQLSGRHERELTDLIVNLGGIPQADREDRPGDQNLPFLSLKFLMPKLVAEKDLILTRYENAKARLGTEYPDLVTTLARIEGEQRHFLEVLGRAAEAVTGGRYTAPAHERPRRAAKGR